MEREINLKMSGWLVVLAQLATVGVLVHDIYNKLTDPIGGEGITGLQWALRGLIFVLVLICFGCYCVIPPNEAKVLQFMGKYKGTLKQNGFIAKNPFWGTRDISLKILTYQSAEIKVNDKNGSPIEIAAVATYKVKDTYKATYAVEDDHAFLVNQFETCLRDMAKKHSYDQLVGTETEFAAELEQVLEKVGYEVQGVKITTLNYAPEISAVMLQKQQAGAMSDARKIIVENAIAMAKHAKEEVSFPDKMSESKFVASLILVLCSERPVTTTLNVNEE